MRTEAAAVSVAFGRPALGRVSPGAAAGRVAGRNGALYVVVVVKRASGRFSSSRVGSCMSDQEPCAAMCSGHGAACRASLLCLYPAMSVWRVESLGAVKRGRCASHRRRAALRRREQRAD